MILSYTTTMPDVTRIYALHHPLTGEVRYVGQTIQLLRARMWGHTHTARKGVRRSPVTDRHRTLVSNIKLGQRYVHVTFNPSSEGVS